ncbi:MAG: trigger factor [Pseudobutyrivibrio ruminis]|uniref:trigger factor n=1 Tax=Pseudobutyrivibrio ruminis TaxID=46206 RepID=UPI0026EDD21A|nr:trigger factor [Pseudobutyrivibrio ruminis]MBE5914627.1 trigger factor [Pseudobutyrivibrio ruminis]
MKNRVLALALATVMATFMVACGSSSDEATEETTQVAEIEYNVDDYVTLGDYKGIEVTIEGEYEYTDEGFAQYVADTIESAAVYAEDDSQTEVQEDSIVNVDYVGSQDGVPFDGGSAEDQMIDVAGNCMAGGTTGFIDGFTAGLVGHSVGDEVAYDVTFPESYGNTDLAGQTVVFTFQINYIAKAIESEDDLTDDVVSANFGYDTVDEYIAALKEEYTASLEDNLENDTETAVLNALINNCTVSEVPEGLLQARVDLILSIQSKQYEAYGTTMEAYLTSMGYDYEEVINTLTENVKESTKTELILEAIANKEGIEVDEEGYTEFITPIYQNMGYTDLDTFYADFTVDGYGGQKYFELAYRTEKATDFCVENAVVNSTNVLNADADTEEDSEVVTDEELESEVEVEADEQ